MLQIVNLIQIYKRIPDSVFLGYFRGYATSVEDLTTKNLEINLFAF